MNSKGFAHLALFVVAIVLLVIVGTGFTVYKASNKSNLSITGTEDVSGSELVTISSENTVTPTSKDEHTPTDAATGTSQQAVTNDITTAYGTLKHVEQEVKAGRIGNTAFFTTPRMLFRSAYMLGVAEDTGVIESACNSNSICQLGAKSTTFTENYTTEAYNYPYAQVEGMTLIYRLKDINPTAAKIYGNVEVRILMLDLHDKWVIDTITVGSHLL